MKTFVTFGQDHRHVINGTVFDRDCVAVVDGDRSRAFELFGPKFCFTYAEGNFDIMDMHHFPRGMIEVQP